MARFDEKINLGFSSVDMGQPLRSYAQEVKQFAQNLGQNVEGIKAGVQSIQATQGAKEAKADILKGGKPTYKQAGMLDQAYAESYNSLMRDAYVSSLTMDSQLELQNIYDKYRGDTDGYNKAVEAYKKGLTAELDIDTASQFVPKFDSIAQSVRMRVNQEEIETNRINALNIIEQAAEASAKNTLIAVKEGTGNDILNTSAQFMEHIQKLKAADPVKYNDKVISDLMDKHSKAMANEGFYRDIDEAAAVSLWDGFDKLDELASSTPKGYTPEEWDNVLAKKYNELYARERELKAQDAENEKALKQQQLLEYGSGLYGLGIPVDPKRTNDQSKYDLEALNTYYDSISDEWSGLPANDQINNNVTFVSRTGIVPSELERRLNAFSRSGSPEQVQVAAEIYGRIQQNNPAAFADLPDETRSFLAMVNESTLAGDPETARNYAYGLTKQQKDEIKLKSADWKAKSGEKLFSDLQSKLDDEYDTFFTFGAPDADAGMKAEYSMNFDRYMMTTGGNAELSQKMAYDSLKKTWGLTNVGGERKFMKYAPETVYAVPGVDSAWIGRQFNQEMESLGIKGATIGINPAAARQKNPEYQVLMPDENGVMVPAHVVDENGNIRKLKPWRPDFTYTEEYALSTTRPTGLAPDVKTKIMRKREAEYQQSIGIIRARVRQGESVETAIQNAISLKKVSPRDKERLMQYFAESGE